MTENNDEDSIVAARLLVNISWIIRHEDLDTVAEKTGIERARLQEILTMRAYPDGYEIAQFQRAYRRRIWPGPDLHTAWSDS